MLELKSVLVLGSKSVLALELKSTLVLELVLKQDRLL